MNGKQRLEFAVKRSGDWHVSDCFVAKMAHTQDFINDKEDLFIQVTYCGYTVKGARLWDFSDEIVTNAEYGVARQRLLASDRDKAARIEAVLLGNSRRF